MTAPACLERLDNTTRSKIRSTQILTSLPQIVSELIQNSLDAGAKNIDVGVHCGDWLCWVTDDGSGINKEGLSLVAHDIEGGRYYSSKSYSPASLEELNTFGFRGEALASAADLSCLEISSRTARSKESWSIIMKGGEKLYYGPSLRWRREAAGTTVSIRDAFFNLPVRRLAHPSPARTFDLVRRELESFALVSPQVKFGLRDLSRENAEGSDNNRILTIPRTSSILLTFRHLYGRALVEDVDMVDCESGSMRIEGFFSLVGTPAKSFQFLYLNRHILGTCELHRVIDKCFSSSTFGKHALDELGQTDPSVHRSPRKGENRPVYVLNITLPPREVDNCLEPTKAAVHLQDQEAVASFLADVVQSFLSRQGFKNSQSLDRPHNSENWPYKRRKVNARDDDGDDYNHRKDSEIVDPNCTSGVRENSMYPFLHTPSLGQEHEEFRWTDPNTGKTYSIDPRTGNSSLPQWQYSGHETSVPSNSSRRRTLVDTRWLGTSERMADINGKEAGGEMPDWMMRALESNDVFATAERSVPCLPCSKNMAKDVDSTTRIPWTTRFNEAFSTSAHLMGELGTIPEYAFTKDSLSEVQVLGQVDCKFIACLLDTSVGDSSSGDREERSRVLVLVDQHAADERVRVERFLRTLCLGYLDRDGIGVEKRMLDPPLPVLLTSFECHRLTGAATFKKALCDWGFTVVETRSDDRECPTSNSDEGYGTVYFSSIPEVAADKLLSGSNSDLRELVKGYLARLESESIDDSVMDPLYISSSSIDVDEFAWLTALRKCPRELVELVNSRACRGAIMFNDRLSMEQCKRLLRHLSMTAFPFQCAHGRPSIVPLTSVRRRPDGAFPRFRGINWSSL